MHQKRISLDGTWQFLHSSSDRVSQPVSVREITVPGPWQAQFPDLRTRGGTGIYRQEFDVPPGWLSRASSRWAGSTAGLPDAAAAWTAAASAC